VKSREAAGWVNSAPAFVPAHSGWAYFCDYPEKYVMMVSCDANHEIPKESETLKNVIKRAFRSLSGKTRRDPSGTENIADAELYRPLFSPWFSKEFEHYYDRAARRSLVSRDRCYVLYSLGMQAAHVRGDFWECGVYKGGTAALLAALLQDVAPEKRLHLFDTFEGMPETDAQKDLHKQGDFADTSLSAVKAYVGRDEAVVFHPGFIPSTFPDLKEEAIAFAHIDVDIHKSIMDCLEFIWPRLSSGGVIVFDDYGFPTCPGARQAVDTFFAAKHEVPLCLGTGQAIVFKLS
jgi:O-methyltransferase